MPPAWFACAALCYVVVEGRYKFQHSAQTRGVGEMVEQPLFVVSSGKVEWVLCGSVTKRKGKEKRSLLGILVKDIKTL